MNMPHRVDDLIRFYDLLDRLEQTIGGKRWLLDCNGKMIWPARGIYFFMEDGEIRTDTGQGLRIVRVGTHALKPMSGTTLWGRLHQHKGQEKSGGGNHRGSIFRLLVGTALIKKAGRACPTWRQGNTAKGETRKNEEPMERNVSSHIRKMPLVWLAVDDGQGLKALEDISRRTVLRF